MRNRIAAGVAIALILLATGPVSSVWAAAEVHRLSLMLSTIPTQIQATQFNDGIDYFNRTVLLLF